MADYYDPKWDEWVPAASLPYATQTRPRLVARLAVLTIFRRYRCQAKWWCSWPATEQGGTCDPHADNGSRKRLAESRQNGSQDPTP